MRSKATRKFWWKFDALPQEIQERARRAYKLWLREPHARGLNFKRVSADQPIYSVRIGLEYRAIGILRGDTVVWYWIGHHDDYERLI